MRDVFSSRLGFILAAAGSAVGLGNIWGFPTQVAANGGGAFVLVYIILAFILAYPVLVAELLVGRYASANSVKAYSSLSKKQWLQQTGASIGYLGLITVSSILSFYAIVGGWMMAYFSNYFFLMLGMDEVAKWVTAFGLPRNILFCVLFSLLTVLIVRDGVRNGIEAWSKRLMPLLLLIIFLLIIVVATQEGAAEGWRVYWVPDFNLVLNSELILSAMGQAFFSLSLGVGTMLIYGSYIAKSENIARLSASVAGVDIGIAILAGLLIIPAIYVAQHNGVSIYNEANNLISGDGLIFSVLPQLFESLTTPDTTVLVTLVALAFFALMVVAALTSSISMLEPPVAFVIERFNMTRTRSAFMIGSSIFALSLLIISNFEQLFGKVIQISTEYSQPLLGLLICVFVGWVWNRNKKLNEIKQGFENVESSWFWRIWPFYVRFICPLLIILTFMQTLSR